MRTGPDGGIYTAVNSDEGPCFGAELICCEAEGVSKSVNWRYVGEGRGQYQQDDAYSFVGEGCGNYEMEEVVEDEVWRCKPACLALLLLAAVLAVAIVVVALWPRSAPVATTTALFEPPSASCLIYGDPHVTTFDGMKADYYTAGEYWIVKSERVKIQGRYQSLPITNGLAVTTEVAVSGSFVDNKVLIIGATAALWEDQPILTSFPSEFDDAEGLLHIRYDSAGEYLQKGRQGKLMHVVHVALPDGLSMVVNRWNEAGEGAYINAKITMSPVPGQDGHCGNFNGDPADDDRLLVRQRLGVNGVAVEEMLFKGAKTPIVEANRPDLNQCPQETLGQAKAWCKPQSSNGMLDAGCLIDYCFGGKAFAEQGSYSRGSYVRGSYAQGSPAQGSYAPAAR